MSDRYGYCEYGHTAWCVVDNRDRTRALSLHDMEHEARAEAARLNAEAPKRAAPSMRWAVVRPGGQMGGIYWNEETARFAACCAGDRIARVRIEEIDE